MNSPRITKIGIIKNAPLPADLSRNLRHIVQGYRDCIDHGAELVIAPAVALCGANLRDLVHRHSFLHQQMSALDTLSRELGDVPLLIGAYIPLLGNTENMEADYYIDCDTDAMYPESDLDSEHVALVPYLLEHDSALELFEGEVNEVAGLQIYIDTEDEPVCPPDHDMDLVVHMGTNPWNAESSMDAAEDHRWEAELNGVPIICVHHVGTVEENLYGGGSCIHMPDRRILLRLPFFEEASKVANLRSKGRAAAPPKPVELLGTALARGIRDTVENNGYRGICLPLDDPNSALLAVLSTRALGASKVVGVSFRGNASSAASLGIHCRNVDLSALTASAGAALGCEVDADTRERLKGNLLCAIAEEHGYMLLTPLERHRLMTGSFTLYGETCGYLAPLGNLYEIDILLLCNHFAEQYAGLFGTLEEPPAPEDDRIIHELADLNNSPSALLSYAGHPYKENDVRQIQRRIIASALKRSQFPITLHVDKPEQQLSFPVCHRLND